MMDPGNPENDFLKKITEIIEENISNERFGVSELAGAIGMSRSNLLRKVNKLTNLSASRFIRQVRLKNGMELLRQNAFNVSEVAYKVGFSSTSYFIKCFHDFYGYPPGEVGKREVVEGDPDPGDKTGRKRSILVFGATAVLLISVVLFIVFKATPSVKPDLEKSIAVLPFKNDSNDSTNVYLINGLMESVLDNLQKIEDLRVISRTSVEKYRNNPSTIPEIARELNVNYFVEGSGQKIGDQILLHIQLIEASSDRHLWSEQYSREASDIFSLQLEVAKSIADEIEAIITPEEEERIEHLPTENLVAYDYFLKGLDHFRRGTREDLEEAIVLFEKATEHDPEFARAFADIALSYAFLDMFKVEKKHSELINENADKAMLYDPKLPQSLIAKAMFHINNREYELALPYLEKALEYNPNSSLAINVLSDFYTSYMPDTEKYLEYALKGIGLDIAAHDSAEASFIYLHLSNAFMQSGFVNEAETYIDKSLEYDPANLYAEMLRAYILYARDRDLRQTKDLLLAALKKDTSRLDIMRELGVICYYMRDYKGANKFYSGFVDNMEAGNMQISRGEFAKIGYISSQLGFSEEAADYFREYLEYAENDNSLYKHLSLSVYYSYMGDPEKAVEEMKLFSEEENFPYWYILFLDIDPLFDKVNDIPEFKQILREIRIKFWNNHKEVKEGLERKELI